MNSYCDIILPFGQKTKKIIVHIFEKYSFFFGTKERIRIKLTMECIDADELNDNKIMDKDFLEKKVDITNETEFDSNINMNMIGMDSDEKKKEIPKTTQVEVNKLLAKIKYEEEHPNEQIKNKEENFIEEKLKINQGNKILGVIEIFKPWSETEKKIKEESCVIKNNFYININCINFIIILLN